MKRLLLLTTLCAFLIKTNYAQVNPGVGKSETKTSMVHYLQKSKRELKTGVIIAGTGVVLGVIGAATFPNDYNLFGGNSAKTETNATISSIMVLAGTGLLIGSIPCFITSIINKHRARVLVKTDKVSLSPNLKLPGMQFRTGITIGI